ncbi:hypothetical protein [Halovivax limisalsi]|uniref:hypothetical protein n=1 Tax=Halovivax limisalsi TaxID=1453760 RepID=UPI001FFC39F3|nr:hypothetical protein [Halovivax limisalsi]
MTGEFVRASRLYDVESRTPIAHPATQATDAEVREAIATEERQLVTDGGTTRRDELIREAEEKARAEIEADALRYYKLRAEFPALLDDCYREMALERGRPTDPCQCQQCDCELHTFPGDVGCIWCSNGQHRETENQRGVFSLFLDTLETAYHTVRFGGKA